MALVDDIYEAIEFLEDAVKDLANGRIDQAEDKIESARTILAID